MAVEHINEDSILIKGQNWNVLEHANHIIIIIKYDIIIEWKPN